MDTNDIRPLLRHHWAFWVFDHFPQQHYIVIGFIISATIFALGAVGAAIAGDWQTYLLHPLAYVFLLGFTLVFFSYGWWRDTLVQVLVSVFPAFDVTAAEYKQMVSAWDRGRANQVWVGVLLGLPIAALNWRDAHVIWGLQAALSSWGPIEAAVWGPWVSSGRAVFFEFWYGLLHVGLEGFFLGSGLAGLAATIDLLGRVMHKNLRLAYYRQLDAPIALGTKLAFWTLIALTAVALFSRPTALGLPAAGAAAAPVAANSGQFLIGSTALQTALALGALVGVFGLPFLMCHNAIEQAKAAYCLPLQRLAESVYQNIQENANKAAGSDSGTTAEHTEQFEALQKQLNAVNELIKSVDDLPTWPITWSARLQLLGGFGASVFSPFVLEQASKLLRVFFPNTPVP